MFLFHTRVNSQTTVKCIQNTLQGGLFMQVSANSMRKNIYHKLIIQKHNYVNVAQSVMGSFTNYQLKLLPLNTSLHNTSLLKYPTLFSLYSGCFLLKCLLIYYSDFQFLLLKNMLHHMLTVFSTRYYYDHIKGKKNSRIIFLRIKSTL